MLQWIKIQEEQFKLQQKPEKDLFPLPITLKILNHKSL